MRITKFGHACIRIEHDGARVVIDPGVFTDRGALDGATAVLITHEHPDHYVPAHLQGVDAPVWTIDAVAAKIRDEAPDVAERTTVVEPGQRFDVDGLSVTAIGELHAVIHPEFPRFDNSGYRIEVDGSVLFHPGDAMDQIETGVDVLFLPVSAPWARSSELIDFARAVNAPMSVAIHDRIYSEAGAGIFDTHLTTFLQPAGLDYKRLADGEDL